MSRDYPFLVAVLGDHNPPFQNRRRHIEVAAAHFLPPPYRSRQGGTCRATYRPYNWGGVLGSTHQAAVNVALRHKTSLYGGMGSSSAEVKRYGHCRQFGLTDPNI